MKNFFCSKLKNEKDFTLLFSGSKGYKFQKFLPLSFLKAEEGIELSSRDSSNLTWSLNFVPDVVCKSLRTNALLAPIFFNCLFDENDKNNETHVM